MCSGIGDVGLHSHRGRSCDAFLYDASLAGEEELSPMEDRIDLVDGAFWGRNPHDELTWLRKNAPVWRDPKHGVWGVATYDLVKQVSSQPKLFSSAGGIRPDSPAESDDDRHGRSGALDAAQTRQQGVYASSSPRSGGVDPADGAPVDRCGRGTRHVRSGVGHRGLAALDRHRRRTGCRTS